MQITVSWPQTESQSWGLMLDCPFQICDDWTLTSCLHESSLLSPLTGRRWSARSFWSSAWPPVSLVCLQLCCITINIHNKTNFQPHCKHWENLKVVNCVIAVRERVLYSGIALFFSNFCIMHQRFCTADYLNYLVLQSRFSACPVLSLPSRSLQQDRSIYSESDTDFLSTLLW